MNQNLATALCLLLLAAMALPTTADFPPNPMDCIEPAVNLGCVTPPPGLLPEATDNSLPGPPANATCFFGYSPTSYVNLCLTGPQTGPFGLGVGGRSVCLVDSVCPQVPTLNTEGNSIFPFGVYVEVLCNQPAGCGCGGVLTEPVYACTWLQG